MFTKKSPLGRLPLSQEEKEDAKLQDTVNEEGANLLCIAILPCALRFLS